MQEGLLESRWTTADEPRQSSNSVFTVHIRTNYMNIVCTSCMHADTPSQTFLPMWVGWIAYTTCKARYAKISNQEVPTSNIHTRACMHINICINRLIHAYMYTYLHTCIHTYICAHLHVYIRTYIHTSHIAQQCIIPSYNYCPVSFSQLNFRAHCALHVTRIVSNE